MAVETMKEDKGGAAQALEFHTGIALNFRQTHAWVCASEDPECFDITMFKFKVTTKNRYLKHCVFMLYKSASRIQEFVVHICG